MTTIEDKMQERMDQRPDQHTYAWWQDQFEQVVRGYRGLTHACNVVLARIEDRDAAAKELREELRVQGNALREAKVAIGELQAEMTKTSAALVGSREAYRELRDKVNSITS